jgi:hypothetical protein
MFGYFGGLIISIAIVIGGVIFWFKCRKDSKVGKKKEEDV